MDHVDPWCQDRVLGHRSKSTCAIGAAWHPARCCILLSNTSLHATLSYPGVTKVSNAVSLGGVDGILSIPAIVSPFITSHVPTSVFPQAPDAPEL